MGIRGIYGFSKGNIKKVMFNEFDSYPDDLGIKIVEFIESTSIEEMNSIFDRIIMVSEFSKPTKDEIEKCIDYSDLSMSNKRAEDWYMLLRKAQGNLGMYKEGLKYMLSEEYGTEDWNYIIDLDSNCLRVYSDWGKVDTSYSLEDVDKTYMLDLQDKVYSYNKKENKLEL